LDSEYYTNKRKQSKMPFDNCGRPINSKGELVYRCRVCQTYSPNILTQNYSTTLSNGEEVKQCIILAWCGEQKCHPKIISQVGRIWAETLSRKNRLVNTQATGLWR
jgi:hypothetical protein